MHSHQNSADFSLGNHGNVDLSSIADNDVQSMDSEELVPSLQVGNTHVRSDRSLAADGFFMLYVCS